MPRRKKDSELRKQTRALIKEARERIKEAKEDGVSDLNIFKTIGTKAKKIANGKRKGVYMKHADIMPEHDLKAYNRVLTKFLNSKQTTREGRNKILKKARDTYYSRNDVEKSDVIKLYDIFATDIYHKLLEKGTLDSEQVEKLVDYRYNDEDGEQTLSERTIETILNDWDNYKKLKTDGERDKYIAKTLGKLL